MTAQKRGPKKGNKKRSTERKGPTKPAKSLIVTPEDPEDKDVDDHPYAHNHCIVVKYRDNSDRLACIIEREEREVDGESAWHYYVHYQDFNRRMDEWVSGERIVEPPSVANEIEEVRKTSGYYNHGLPKAEDGKERAEPGDLSKLAALKINTVGSKITTIADDEHDEHEGLDENSMREHNEITKVKNIMKVEFGKHIMECWYFSPFPKEYFEKGSSVREFMYFCEFTFRFFRTKEELLRYQAKPGLPRYPPGREIYRDENVSMFELDGLHEKIYCQNLCYFAKLFLDHKTLYYDVDHFLFYVLCTRDRQGFHPVGFYSKEKYSDLGFNLACILTFPCAQRKGFGRFLISFSYELSKKEGKIGSPEKPLSDLGAVSYRSYWGSGLLAILKDRSRSEITISELCRATSITPDDVLFTLNHLGLIHMRDNRPILCCPPDVIDDLMKKYPRKGLLVDPNLLHWTPLYVIPDPRKDKWSLKAKKDCVELP